MKRSDHKVCKTCSRDLPKSAFDQWANVKRYKNQCRECVQAFYDDLNKRKNSDTKKCVDCGLEKLKDQFYFVNTNSKELHSRCIPCTSEYKKKRYWGNREEELAKYTKSRLKPENVLQRKSYYEENKAEYKARHNKYMADEEKKKRRRENNRQYEQNNKEKINARKRARRKTEEGKEVFRKRHHQRKNSDFQYVIKRRLRNRLKHVLEAIGAKKSKQKSAVALLGCDLIFFKKYIESLFIEGMNWEQIFSGELHLDHFVPCKRFNLTLLEEQQICFNYRNIRLLPAKDNILKRDKMPEGVIFEEWFEMMKSEIF